MADAGLKPADIDGIATAGATPGNGRALSEPDAEMGRRHRAPPLLVIEGYGLAHETLVMVSVVQRDWAAKNPRATFRTPITVEDMLNSRIIRLPVPAIAVLSGDRWRQCVDSFRRAPATSRKACPWSEQGAGLSARHR
jgi:hypothetical protein